MKKITALLIGAGQRGTNAYGAYAQRHPDELSFAGVAEPRRDRREAFAHAHNIPVEFQFEDWREALTHSRFAGCAFICTQDREHFAPAMAALNHGYHVLCEKPMSPEKNEILALADEAERTGLTLSVCHVLRYSPFFTAIKHLLDGGAIGQLVCIEHLESVGYWHAAHSYVRGNWRKSEVSPMILAKSCHDTDILQWLAGSECECVTSFGSLAHFNAAHAPEGAPARCTDGCKHQNTCPYYAPRFYLHHVNARSGGFISVLTLDQTSDGVMKALREGPYGRCVYHCDNDVVDHQTVQLRFQNGVHASFVMSAFTKYNERVINLMGSRGQIRGNMDKNVVELWDFATGSHTTIGVDPLACEHNGSDDAMLSAFTALLRGEQGTENITDARLSAKSHLVALAAEKSRLMGGMPVDMAAFAQEQ